MRGSSPLEKRQKYDEMVNLFGATREDKQAHAMQVLTARQIQAKEMEDLKQKGVMSRQALTNTGTASVAGITGGFGVQRQGLANVGSTDTQSLRNIGAAKVAEIKEAGALKRAGSFDENVVAGTETARVSALEDRRKIGVDAVLAGVPGEEAEKLLRDYRPLEDVNPPPIPPQPNKFIAGEPSFGSAMPGLPDRIFNPDERTVTAIPTTSDSVLIPGFQPQSAQALNPRPMQALGVQPDLSLMKDDTERYNFLSNLKKTDLPAYQALLKKYMQ